MRFSLARYNTKMYKRVSLATVLLGTLGVGVYFVYFHRPPTEDILAANAARSRNSMPGLPQLNGADIDFDKLDDGTLSKLQWQDFIEKNNYVSIGSLFNKCDGDDILMIGTVILLPDKKEGGITSKTFLNLTIEREVDGGEMYLECQYNGKALYSNHWDVCHVEDDMEDRIINCPIKRGRRKFIKDLKIPNYLPKGHYTTKAWIVDPDDKEIGCAYADFTI